MRYRLYREHKYISFMLSEFERLTAKTDFTDNQQVKHLQQQLSDLINLMLGHAEHENHAIHSLLKQKVSKCYEAIEAEHLTQEKQFEQFTATLVNILTMTSNEEKNFQGYQFYLAYRLFVSENLQHLHQEETIIMSELQRLYTDEELRRIDFKAYSHMTPEELLHMTTVLFPHMNSDDKQNFINDIRDAEPEKFKLIADKLVNDYRFSA